MLTGVDYRIQLLEYTMLNEICPQHVFLDKTNTLFFDRYSKALFEWNSVKEELKPIKYKAAFKKYRANLNSFGEEFFGYEYDKEAAETKKAFLYNCLFTTWLSASIVTFFAGFIFTLNPDTEYSFQSRVLVFFASTIPGCVFLSYCVAISED